MSPTKGSGLTIEAVDVYETSDLPEVDQHLAASDDTETNDAIEVLPITANEAFGRFKGSYLDSRTVDFSDKIRNDRRQGRLLNV